MSHSGGTTPTNSSDHDAGSGFSSSLAFGMNSPTIDSCCTLPQLNSQDICTVCGSDSMAGSMGHLAINVSPNRIQNVSPLSDTCERNSKTSSPSSGSPSSTGSLSTFVSKDDSRCKVSSGLANQEIVDLSLSSLFDCEYCASSNCKACLSGTSQSCDNCVGRVFKSSLSSRNTPNMSQPTSPTKAVGEFAVLHKPIQKKTESDITVMSNKRIKGIILAKQQNSMTKPPSNSLSEPLTAVCEPGSYHRQRDSYNNTFNLPAISSSVLSYSPERTTRKSSISSPGSSRSNSVGSSTTLPLDLTFPNHDSNEFESQSSAMFYCHWGDQCDEVSFATETDFDLHLKSIHLNLDKSSQLEVQEDIINRESAANKRSFDEYMPQNSSENNDDKFLHCNWDQCNAELTELDDILEHIKVDHSVSSREYPHSLCHNPILSRGSLEPEQDENLQAANHTTPGSTIDTINCPWLGCHFVADSTNSLDQHQCSHHPASKPSTSENKGFRCEWKSCNYVCNDINEFMAHVKQAHVSCMIENSNNSTVPSLPDNKQSSFASQFPSDTQGTSANRVSQFSDISQISQINQIHQNANILELQQFSQLSQISPGVISSNYAQINSGHHQLLDSQQEFTPSRQQQFYTPEQELFTNVQKNLSTAQNLQELSETSEISDSSSKSCTKEEHVTDHVCRWVTDGKECGVHFKCTQSLNQHVIDDHIGSRKTEYVCNWAGCERHGRPFAQRQKIHRHLITHTKNKPYVCSVCGNAFSEALVLKQHFRVHSGERPFQCKKCHKSFAASTALSVHMRTHTGEKPLVCKWPGCNKRFSESSNLAKHMKSMYIKFAIISIAIRYYLFKLLTMFF